MQRAYSLLVTGLILLFQTSMAGAAGYEHEGEIYHFRLKDDALRLESSAGEKDGNPAMNHQDDQQMLRSLEEQGYVFRPLRKRKTIEDPTRPVEQAAVPTSRQQEVQACPAPVDPMTVPQVNPAQAVPQVTPYPVAPTMITPPLGYPYTYPSPYSYPYPSGGVMPFPGGFGMPW
ncbi:MAG: hypothetical protein PVG47_02270 [Chromatiales bacterium]|jgi:hypothetical protein